MALMFGAVPGTRSCSLIKCTQEIMASVIIIISLSDSMTAESQESQGLVGSTQHR
jgi:hypothetical protein